AVDQFLSFLFIPAPASIYNEIKKLPPAHYLLCTERGVSVREYWDVPLPPEGDEDCVDEPRLRDCLKEAVRMQLRSDVPVGAFLSGGIDSTAVVDAMVESLGPGIVTCSVGFAEEGYSELPYASMVAQHLGSLHQESVVEAPGPEMIERLCWHFDEPFADSSAVPTWAVSGLARRRVKVALSGDGGDELFGGYRRHAIEMWEHNLREYGPWGPWAAAKLAGALPISFRGRNTLLRLGVPPDQACALKFQFASGADEFKAGIYSEAFRDEAAKGDALEPFRRAFQRAAAADPINRILYVDLKTSLADDMLVKVDRMSMAHGLEVRAPYLDHRLVELVARLPGSAKLPRPAAKPLLRSMLNGRIPHGAWDRPKHGFTAPIGSWLRTGLRGYVEEVLFSPSSLGAQLFDKKRLRRLWQEHLAGRKNSHHELWMLLMLEVWHRTHARRRALA
ncbi:MAG: asparagine synthetase B, partial [Candidatus Rokubacteria bacterium]|nr:asparagine synthetase B [Candidatus Rokubacteria bacterium]